MRSARSRSFSPGWARSSIGSWSWGGSTRSVGARTTACRTSLSSSRWRTTRAWQGPARSLGRWRARPGASGQCSAASTRCGCSVRTRWRWPSRRSRGSAAAGSCSGFARTCRYTCATAIRDAAGSTWRGTRSSAPGWLARRHAAIVVGPELARRYARAGRVLELSVSLIAESDIAYPETVASRSYDGELRALSVGRLEQEKNPLLLADVLAALPDPWRLFVCGDGPLAGALESRLRAAGRGRARGAARLRPDRRRAARRVPLEPRVPARLLDGGAPAGAVRGLRGTSARRGDRCRWGCCGNGRGRADHPAWRRAARPPPRSSESPRIPSFARAWSMPVSSACAGARSRLSAVVSRPSWPASAEPLKGRSPRPAGELRQRPMDVALPSSRRARGGPRMSSGRGRRGSASTRSQAPRAWPGPSARQPHRSARGAGHRLRRARAATGRGGSARRGAVA